MNINDLIDQYEQGARLRGLGPTQMTALKPVRRGLGRRTPSGRTPGGVTPKAIGDYVAERRAGMWSKVHGSRPAADGTIRRELGALSAVLNWAHQKRILKDAPPSIDLPPMSPPRENFLTLAEADELFSYASVVAAPATIHEDKHVGRFACMALDTWARANAIETLTWDRVDLDRGLVDYRDPLRPVTAKRRVPVPVSSRLRPILEQAHRERRDGDDFVIGHVTQYQWKQFLKDSGLRTDVTRHDLRRTGISLAVARGVDLMKIAQMAGDNYQTILKFYARFSPSYLEGCVT